MVEPAKKICTLCKEEKHLIFFAKCCSNKDGLTYWCEDCRKAKKRKSTIDVIRDKQRADGNLEDFQRYSGNF